MKETRTDPHTGFLDRYSCLQMASELVGNMNGDTAPLSVIWIDLDRFKHLNESFGYAGGDNVVAEIAQRLKRKATEGIQIGRVGVDEFVLLAPNLDIKQAEKLCVELMRVIEPPMNVGDFQIRLTASVGIAELEMEECAEELLERADWSKNTAKRQGGNCYIVSGQETIPSHMGIIQAREELEVEFLLHSALENGGLQLHYQPIVGLMGDVISVEALMRCSVNGKNIPPSRFFPVAEKNGLLVLLGDWSLLQGTQQAKHLNQASSRTTVSINVSKGQLSNVDFAQALQAAIILANVDPTLIELEFSETLFIDMNENIRANLRQAGEMGVHLAVDNFGNGYSCLANLKDIPATKLKLGRKFTSSMAHDRRAYSVIKSMIRLGKDLDMDIIAEGIETKDQMELLADLSVDGMQGFYFAKPMDVVTLSGWLKERAFQ